MFRDIFKFLASLKLALLLLAVIIVASIFGTIYESDFNAEVARKYIYNAPWFNLWMGMLCVNLFAVAAIRYPWKPHQTGFVITHAGIITLLIGGMIDRQWGSEGFVRLFRGAPPTNILELPEEDLVVQVGDTSARTKVIAKSFVWPADFKVNVASPSADVKVEIVDKYPPLAQIVLQGPQMGRHEMWMFLNDKMDLGPAVLRFAYGMPPEPKPAKPEAEKKMVPRSEWHFVFSKQEFPIVKVMAGDPIQGESKLVLDADGKNPRLKLAMFGKNFDLDVNANLEKTIPLEGLAGWTLHIRGYFPNFRMIEGKPATLDDKPGNPAVICEFTGPLVAQSEAEDDPHGGARKGGSSLALYLGSDGKLRYFMKTKSKGESAGEVELDKPIPAWAPGSEFVVQKFFSTGLTDTLAKDASALKGANLKQLNERSGGLLCRVTVGSESRVVWVPESLPKEVEPIKLEVGGKSVELALPHRFLELPFCVSLERFVAGQQEGLEGMRHYDTFESTLSFQDMVAGQPAPKQLDTVRLKSESTFLKDLPRNRLNEKGEIVCAITDIDESSLTLDFADLPSSRSSVKVLRAEIADFTKRTHKILMNRPTTYPENWYGPWLGINYKFSQAGHDANMPDYSGVQVLRDPGWAPKWIGCLMICFGIFTMFYLKPYFHGRRELKAAMAAAPNAKAEPAGKPRRTENLAAGN